MNKTLKYLLCVSIIFNFQLSTFNLSAQKPLIDSLHMPNAVHFLPPPPDTASAAFQYDKAQYRWGLEQRKDSARLAIAVGDAIWSIDNICKIYSGVLGITISPENTPTIYRMLTLGLLTTDQAGKLPKNHYMRTRPYVFYDQPTIAPGDEEVLRHNGSYPSGHTILGWSAALLLTEMAPECADTILARGYMYGQSRVIAGYHWQSDVDAARLVASAAVARLHADKRFHKLMKKARKEYKKLKKNG
ncbi:MAG: phosphatase PAP2 family protein [Bacteroidales bacterium]|nr:phosphatase PAP2 family protein [Bacteroidales bacterium]